MGGKSPFGIDASRLTQMVYRIAGYTLYRDMTSTVCPEQEGQQ